MDAKKALYNQLKKFLKGANQDFVDKILDIYYKGSLQTPLITDEPRPTFDEELKVIIHFCTGQHRNDIDLSLVLQGSSNELRSWLNYREALLSDEEAYVLYNILINIYLKIYEIH